MDGSQKLGSLEEQIYFLAQAFRAEGSLFLPLFLEPSEPPLRFQTPVGNGAPDAKPNGGVIEAFAGAGLPTESLSLWGFEWKTLWRLYRLIGTHNIQLVHWNFYAPVNSYLLALSALRPRLRHYFTDHNSRSLPLSQPRRSFRWLVKRALLKRYSKVWCVSRFVQDCLAAQRNWSNLKCCLHFINTDRFCPDSQTRQAVRKEQGCEDRFVVVAVAHLIREKGIDVAIRAIAEAPPRTVLWVVGIGSEAESLQALCNELGLQDRVKFLGQKAQVQPYLQAADCLVCPSVWAEAAGLVNLEGSSAGLPVVASRVGGIPEYVDEGHTGMLFPPGNHGELAALLRRLHDSPEERRRMGEAGRAAAVGRFSVPSKINEYLDLYRTS
jgi:glycosyltransferase involved in cell wall biosynthesis